MADERARGLLVNVTGNGRGVYKGALLAALDAASTLNELDYVASGWPPVVSAVAYGEAVYDDPYAGEFQADKATRDINDAIAGLVPFVPTLFDGIGGAWLSIEDETTTFEQSGTPADANNDPLGLILDKSGNGSDATQDTGVSKPLLQLAPKRHALFDDSDDSITFDVPAGGWSGTYVQGTMAGVIVGEISVPAGLYQIPTDPNYANQGTLTELIIRDDGGVIDPGDLEQLVGYVGQRGNAVDFAGETAWDGWFRGRSDLTKIDLSRTNPGGPVDLFFTFFSVSNLVSADLSGFPIERLRGTFRSTALVELVTNGADFSQCTNINEAVQATPIETLDVSDWDLPLLNGAERFANGCGNLTTVIVYGGSGSNFAGSPNLNYDRAFLNTNLSQQSYTDIVTAIESAGTSNGVLDITGGSATTTGAAQTAVDALRLRGWAVTTPDGY